MKHFHRVKWSTKCFFRCYCCDSYIIIICIWYSNQLSGGQHLLTLPRLSMSRFDCEGKGDSSCPVELWDNKPEELLLPSRSPTSPSCSPSSLQHTTLTLSMVQECASRAGVGGKTSKYILKYWTHKELILGCTFLNAACFWIYMPVN